MKRKALLLIAVFFVFTTGLSACNPPVADTRQFSNEVLLASGDILRSDKSRATTADVTGAAKKDLSRGNGSFAIDLYHQLRNTNGNLFFSPYSISSALAMTYAGANGTTAEQMGSVLHFELPQVQLHPAFNWLDSELTSRGEGAKGKDGEEFRLNIVNNLWGQKNYEFRESFLDTIAENYGAGLRILDYINKPEESRITINNWISEQTENRINDLIPSGYINSFTRLVLTNAVYFNAAWKDEFPEGSVMNRPFYLLDGTDIQVPMMMQTTTYGYTDGSDYQAVELPYDGEELSLLILLPEKGLFTEFEQELDYPFIESVFNRLHDERVRLTMPKFRLESQFQLKAQLTKLGMPLAFTEQADFSGITPEKDPFFIGDVIHKAFIEVDTKGTEAAAATAITMMTMSPPGSKPKEPIVVDVDRPFIFLIRDIETDTILFIGRTLSPDPATSLTESTDELYFPVQNKAWEEEIATSLNEELVIRNGYFYAGDDIIIWPEGYSYKESGEDIWIIDETGGVTARVGDEYTFHGRAFPSSQLDYITDFKFPGIFPYSYTYFLLRDIER